MKAVPFEEKEVEDVVGIIRKEREACIAVAFLLENLSEDLQTKASSRQVEVISGSARILLQVSQGLSTAAERLVSGISPADV